MKKISISGFFLILIYFFSLVIIQACSQDPLSDDDKKTNPGSGSLSINTTWDPSLVSNPIINATLTPAGGTASSITFTVDASLGTATYSNAALAAGYYELTVELFDGGTKKSGRTENILIAADETSSLTITFTLSSVTQIIADHTVVDRFDDIPAYYIAEVKKMWVSYAGESHSSGVRKGAVLLQLIDSKFAVNVTESGTPEAYTDQHLRLSRATRGDVDSTSWIYSYGEEDWFTSSTAIAKTKTGLTYCHTTGPALSVLAFGWCWDMTGTNAPGGTLDPVSKCRWAGRSDGGPDGSLIWGLDSDDTTLTGNSVCMDTYLNATEEYRLHCINNGYLTKVVFTTGPVDGNSGTENGFQRELKQDHIRKFVMANSERILFDYADILCWNNSGVKNTATWNDGGTPRTHAQIHADNMLDYNEDWSTTSHTEDGDHIGEVGALRLAKAMWWMMARIAGWDGVSK